MQMFTFVKTNAIPMLFELNALWDYEENSKLLKLDISSNQLQDELSHAILSAPSEKTHFTPTTTMIFFRVATTCVPLDAVKKWLVC